jgi:hypothetical protein
MSETAIPPLSASIGSFIEKPMMASTCFTSSGCTPKPMSTSLICGGIDEALLGWGGSWAVDFVARMPG